MKNLLTRLSGWLDRNRSAEERALFVFGTPDSRHTGEMAALFEKEPVFRSSVLHTDRLLRQHGLPGIRPCLEEGRPAALPLPPETAYSVGLASELAILDLWLDRGLRPTAVLGIGLGELAALCAVGAFSRETAVGILSGILQATRDLEPMAALFLPDSTVATLPPELPCPVFPSAVLAPQGLVLLCPPADRPQLETVLTGRNIPWQHTPQGSCLPFHTPLASGLRTALPTALGNVVLQPVGADYYSCTLDKLVPRHTLPPLYLLEDMLCTPIQPRLLLPALQAGTWRTVVHCHTGTPVSGVPATAGSIGWLPSATYRYGSDSSLSEKKMPEVRLRRYRQPAVDPEKDRFRERIDHIDILSPAYATSLPAIFSFLRSHGDIHFIPKNNCWLVLGYELATQVMQDPHTFSNSMLRSEDPFLVGTDPPDHTHLRAVIQPQFSPKAIKEAADGVERDVRRLLESMRNRPAFDVAIDVSIPVARSAARRFLGLDEATFRALQARMPHNIYEADAKAAIGDFFTGYMAQRHPGSTGPSMRNYLLHAVDTGAIRMEQAVGMMDLFWEAGIYTTSLHLTNLVHELIIRPAVAKQLQENPDLVSNFIGECLRLNPPGIQTMRMTRQDTSLGGKTIPAGSVVAVAMLAANRDPDIFPQADDMLLHRPARRDFVFGGGVHFCPGHHLAKREADAVVHTFLPIIDRLELDPCHPPKRLDRLAFQGMTSLPVRWR